MALSGKIEMTGRTIAIGRSDEVMAMFGRPGEFYKGKWQDIRVTEVSADEDVPLEVRRSLVGLIVPTIFEKEKIEKQTGVNFSIPKGSRLAYSPDVVDVLRSAGKHGAAEQLEAVVPSPLDMYVFEEGIYILSR